jgi:hypothetical protein
MTLVLPGWYEPAKACPDIEKNVLRPLFQPLLPSTNVVSWIPKPDTYNAEITAGRSYLRTYRTGGAWNDEEKRDEPRVQFAALTGSRDESWQLIGFVRDILRDFVRESGIVNGFRLSAEGELAGPQLIPELLQDDRIVPITVQLFTWPKQVLNYRAHLGLNDL